MARSLMVPLVCTLTVIGSPGLTQSGNIPTAVISECTAEANASSLPDCLKNGAIAFETLEVARTDDFYGEAATSVIEWCRNENSSFHTTWICFENAAEDAAETHRLIGNENIADSCVAGISDPNVYARLGALYSEKRKGRFPYERFFRGDMYSPFRGCLQEKAVRGNATTGVPASVLGADAAASAPDVWGGDACKAYGDLERLITETDASTLRAIPDRLAALGDGEPNPELLSEATGLTVNTARFFHAKKGEEEDRKWDMRTVALLGAFLRGSHPELLYEFFELTSQENGDDQNGFAQQAAQAFILTIMDAVEESYRQQC